MKNKLNAKRPNIWTLLAWVFVVTSLVFAGCSRQTAEVRDNQTKLQNIVQAHSQQITADATQINEITGAVNDLLTKQTKMQEQITALQGDNQLLREQMITVLKQFKDQLAEISSRIGSSATARQ
jgi:TolA-binding protein